MESEAGRLEALFAHPIARAADGPELARSIAACRSGASGAGRPQQLQGRQEGRRATPGRQDGRRDQEGPETPRAAQEAPGEELGSVGPRRRAKGNTQDARQTHENRPRRREDDLPVVDTRTEPERSTRHARPRRTKSRWRGCQPGGRTRSSWEPGRKARRSRAVGPVGSCQNLEGNRPGAGPADKFLRQQTRMNTGFLSVM